MTTPTLTELIELRRQLPPIPPDAAKASLFDRFIIPPFSVLDARQGYWQKRKRQWLDLGMGYGVRATEGSDNGFREKLETRDGGNFFGHGEQGSGKRGDIQRYKNKRKQEAGIGISTQVEQIKGFKPGKCFNMGMDGEDAEADENKRYSTPVFDPVLCELMFRWFCPPQGHIVDPFAGTALSGIVATKLGRRFTGIDINPQQIDQNRVERDGLCSEEECERLEWLHGDSAEAVEILTELDIDTAGNGGQCDLLFSCPPYGDLVRYSDDPRDISTINDYNKFIGMYSTIIRETCKCLRDDRFAVYVIGDFRDPKTGAYRGFIGDTVAAHRAAGLELYNDMVLVTAIGSLPLRVGKQFTGSRKVGKSHQNVLVFVKGDPVRAAAACGEVDVYDLDMPECRVGGIALEVSNDIVEALEMVIPERAALTCDVAKGQAREASLPIPRCWIGTADGWSRVPDHEELTYVVGNQAYLNRTLFPDARGPSDTAPAPRKLR